MLICLMKLKKYLSTLNDDQKRQLATKLKTSVAYLYQLAGGHRKAGLKIMMLIEPSTDGAVTQGDLRPEFLDSAPKKSRAA